ncbi:hypothetical protein HK103_004419 [Boothiomyces macroporosus]|uniref:Uncharacterized protein n=1 Tax=Boothiomyces macroporosus TaxID=261099 RepID=A0AAD5UGN9_9FUNG|nr:hypothetical protein HK103_004403 [Boothiomyces macroporosus]KAJ3257647.1 hypothetical protein HK103_004419 [Boothiomyces macroporosus]
MTSKEQELHSIIEQKEKEIKNQKHTIILLKHQLNLLQRKNQSAAETQTDERVETRAVEIIHKTITQLKSLIEKDIIADIPDQGLTFIVKALLSLHHKHNLLVEANNKLVVQNKEFIKENLLLLKRKKVIQDDLNTITVLLENKKEKLENEKQEIEILQKHHIGKYLEEYFEKKVEAPSNRFPEFKRDGKDNKKFKGKFC